MPETLALIRLAIARSRLLLLVIGAALGVGELIALLAAAINPEFGRELAIAVLFCTLISAGLASIVLFDYGDNSDMNLPDSGCSHWLLRMPVDSWKIAFVPVMLRSLWIAGLWVVCIGIAWYGGVDEEIPLMTPPICFSAAAIWALVIAWRPFRSGWRRLVALFVAVPVLYCCIGAVFVAPHINQIPWRPAAITASTGVAIAVYLAAVVVAIRSVTMARVCSTGIIPERGGERTVDSSPADENTVQYFNSPRRALAWHDLINSRNWIRRTLIVGVIPSIVGLSLFATLRIDTVVITLIAFAYFALIAVCRLGGTLESSQTLPPYLAASPLSTATIAWTRCLTPLVIAAGVFACVLFVFAGWACWPENREIWFQWATERAESLGRSGDAVTIGVRWVIAIVLASAAFVLGRIASLIWIGMAGRPWVSVVVVVVIGLTISVPIGMVCHWFLQQTDWESTQVSALGYLALAPYGIGVLLAVKGVAVAASAAALIHRRLATIGATLGVIAIWIAITLSIAGLLFLVIPDSRATWAWCLAITSLTIPLARILIQPLALAWNRHR